MIKLGNAALGAAGVVLLAIGVAAQTGSIHLPSLGGAGTVAHRPSNAPALASPSPEASPSPTDQPTPQVAPLVAQPVGEGHGHGHGHGKGHGDH